MKSALLELFSASSKLSMGRLGSFLALLAAFFWVTWLVIQTRALPDLAGITLFITSLYAVSKAAETVQQIKNGRNGGAPPNGPKPPPAIAELHQG